MGLGDFISDIFGSKNKERAAGRNVDANSYLYGGRPGEAEKIAGRYDQTAAGAQGRQATQATNVGVNYSQADQDRAQQQQARQGQSTLAGVMANRATGGGLSIAQQQADRQMGQISAQQASMAGSARGAGGLAAAQRTAAFGAANAGADISGQAQINAAQERRDDTNAAAGMYASMRGGDLSSQNQSANQAQFATQSAAQQNQFNAGLRDNQAARNDAHQLAYDQMGNQVRTTQLGAKTNYEAQQSANALGAQGINAGVGGQNASMNQANAMNVLGMAQGALGAGAGVLAKAKGGPTSEGKPYLVGEEGPELIVPKKDGYVMTAQQTANMLRGSPASTISSLYDRGDKAARSASLSSIMGARCGGGPMPARADGGPVDAGGEAGIAAGLVAPPPAPIPSYQPPMSTWGTGQPDPTGYAWSAAQTQGDALEPYDALSQRIAEQRAGIDATSSRVNDTVAGIDAKDKDAIWNADYKDRHGQKLTQEEDDASTEARYRQGEDAKAKRADAKKKGQASLAAFLGDMGKKEQQAAGAIDTSYHGGGGHYAPPVLIPLAGARAFGGPITAGGLVPLRPDMTAPMMGAGSGAAPTSYEVMTSNGGVNVGASGKAMSDFATKFGRNPGASPIAGAREEGGPVEGTKKSANDDLTEAAKTMALYGAMAASGMGTPGGVISPGAGVVLGANALGTAGAAEAIKAEDAAAKKARTEQEELDAERAAMNAAERAGGPAPAHSVANTVLSLTDKEAQRRIIGRTGDETPWRKQRSLWDILRGK